ncbi:LicD family protein [Legionella taurinensis]|uniref:LicD family protein n=1 Tax=Legionella taurinensis TaxID=70611 RepID=A0A3A5L781_9GAMM|nr:LicD family protein [Legionella taurinensis]MDX1837744.1 LicD family protein [Legionella taurinensis]PUT40024.1 LicD family protein [Legionella taurinensis]PUT43790.1 LicD family protein [Legionella taurinensis]PUT46077.1 LicD family protein [Legionella taurinensis]PUT47945.1 LicD family protein [Legionella taurinensis]
MLHQPGVTFSAAADNAQQDGRLRQAQLKMLEMLKVVDDICQQHELDYWLEGGTLLGAVRHQGFIPWDDDMDISMPRESYDQFLRLAPALLPEHLWLQTAQTDPGYYNLAVPLKIRDKDSRFIEWHERGNEPYHQGIFIDVFVYDHMPANPVKRKLYKWLAKKTVRLSRHKYCPLPLGGHPRLYELLGQLIPKHWLDSLLQGIIRQANASKSPYSGYGFDCVNSNLLPLTAIYPLKRARFESAEFNIINQAEAILTQLYGDYLTLPPIHEQIMKHCRELIPYLDRQKDVME